MTTGKLWGHSIFKILPKGREYMGDCIPEEFLLLLLKVGDTFRRNICHWNFGSMFGSMLLCLLAYFLIYFIMILRDNSVLLL